MRIRAYLTQRAERFTRSCTPAGQDKSKHDAMSIYNIRAVAPRRKQYHKLRDDDTQLIGRGLGRTGSSKSVTAYVKTDEHIEMVPGSVFNGNSKSKPFMWTLDDDAAVRDVVLKRPALSVLLPSGQVTIVHRYNNRVIFSSTVLSRLASSSSMLARRSEQSHHQIHYPTRATHKSSLTLKLGNVNAMHVRVGKHILQLSKFYNAGRIEMHNPFPCLSSHVIYSPMYP